MFHYFLSLCGTSFLQSWWYRVLSLAPGTVTRIKHSHFHDLTSIPGQGTETLLQATAGQGPLRLRHLLYLASIWCYFDPLQCSCLDNPRDEGAWWAAIYGGTQSQTRLKQLSSSSINFFYIWPLNLPQYLFRVQVLFALKCVLFTVMNMEN